MRRLFKYLVRLIIVAALGFAAYAMLADLPPPTVEKTVTLTPDLPEPKPQAPEPATETTGTGAAPTSTGSE